MSRISIVQNALVAAAFFSLALASSLVGLNAQTRNAEIAVNDPRPLSEAVLELERRYGWVITYEDPPYEFGADYDDVTQSVRRDFDYKRRVFVPRGGPFTFNDPTPLGTQPEPTQLIQALLDGYELTNSGEFRLLQTGPVFHVLPTASRDSNGIRQLRQSRLAQRITVEKGPRTALDVLQAIVDATTRPGQYKMTLGRVPTNLLATTLVDGGAMNETSRTVLLRTLAATGRSLSWQLFCDPGVAPECALNIHIVERTKP